MAMFVLLGALASPRLANAQERSSQLGLDGGLFVLDGAAAELSAESSDAGDARDAAEEPADAQRASEQDDEGPAWLAPPLAALPPATPDPELVPIVVDREAVSAPAPIASADRPAVVIGTLLGLLALLSLAFLGAHPRVQELERRLGVSQVITAGFPFVVLGLVARTVETSWASESLLANFSPLLRIGLGCIGFVAGFRFSAQFRSAPSAAVMRVAAWATVVPFALVSGLSGAVLLSLSSGFRTPALSDPVFIRDAIILGTAGAMTARTSTELFRADDVERLLARVLRLEELAGIIGLAVIAAYFRTRSDVAWQLPGTAWLLLTVGLGTTLGLIAYFVFERPQEGPEFVVLTFGTIGFGAGIAGYLSLSPVVVCFIAGTCLALLPSSHKDRIRSALRRVERPVYLLSLMVIGALWQVDDYRGWLLVPVFTGARFLGKWLGTHGAARFSGAQISAEERQVLAVSPMGPLAIAIVVNAQLLYPGGSISPIVAAVIGGAIVTEVVVQLVSRRTASHAAVVREADSIALSEPPQGSR
jgi:hypothetical protein